MKSLKPNHAAALETYLAKNRSLGFMPENLLDRQYLADMRKYFRKGFMPYYTFGDLNGDRLEDFAMLLSRDGEPKETGLAPKTHDPDFPLRIVIFNGQHAGGFKVAFSEDLYGPRASFINYSMKKRKKVLYYGIFETDNTFTMRPTGKGYIVDREDQP